MTAQLEVATPLAASIRALNDRATSIARLNDSLNLDWCPADRGWSAAQVFEHLCITNDSYLETLRSLFPERAGIAGIAATHARAEWRPSLIGRWLASSMVSPRKLPAPKIWRPGPDPRPNVIAEFLERQREIAALIERSMATEWRRMRLASPVSALIRMNVGDAFTIIVRHEERHFGQIDRTLQASPERAQVSVA